MFAIRPSHTGRQLHIIEKAAFCGAFYEKKRDMEKENCKRTTNGAVRRGSPFCMSLGLLYAGVQGIRRRYMSI